MTQYRKMAREMGLEATPKIFARFFDHAIEDKEASRQSDRKRFKHATYLELRNLAEVVQDVFHRKMIPQDKNDYPEQWAAYASSRGEISNRRPSLRAIPGMTEEAYEEFKWLKLWDCEKVMNYEGDLTNLEPFRKVAKQIMEISDEQVREERAMVRNEANGPVHSIAGQVRPAQIAIQKETDQEETFSYQIQVSY